MGDGLFERQIQTRPGLLLLIPPVAVLATTGRAFGGQATVVGLDCAVPTDRDERKPFSLPLKQSQGGCFTGEASKLTRCDLFSAGATAVGIG